MGWTDEQIMAWYAKQNFEVYQEVRLPNGQRIPGENRDRSFALSGDLTGLRVLDVGCHYGASLLNAVNRGAACAVGFEARPQIYAVTQAVVEMYGDRRMSVLPANFEEYEPLSPPARSDFDVVTMFNVSHHFRNPIFTIRYLAEMARLRVVIEWPTMAHFWDCFPGDLAPQAIDERAIVFVGDDRGGTHFTQGALEFMLRGLGRIVHQPSPKAPDRRVVTIVYKNEA